MSSTTKIFIAVAAVLLAITIFTGLVSFILPNEGSNAATPTSSVNQTESMF